MKTKQITLLSISLFIPLFLIIVLATAVFPQTAHAAPSATITVTNTSDSGAGSLREAIASATAGDTIDFNVNGTIVLGSELVITKSVTINGGNVITVSGNNVTRVFNVTAGNVTFDSLSIISGTVSGNGGGIAVANSAAVTVTNSTLSGNSASSAGGIYNDNSMVTVSNSILSGNSAADGIGGGIVNFGTMTVSNSTLSGNSADIGGGIYNDSRVTVSNSTLFGNSAGRGGGIQNYSGGAVTVSNSTLSGNSANYGGGINNYSSSLIVSNSTLSGNSANFGGGIFAWDASDERVSNSIIANSASGGDCVGEPDHSIISGGYNLDSDGSCGLSATGDITNTNPLPGPLADNGGPTLTHALLAGSPAIDAGNCSSGPATDQRGVARPQNGQCDIGAVEMGRWYTLFMPIVVNQYVSAPDLIVEDVTVSDNAAVVDPFWVDMYINPTTPPTGINQTWETNGGEGLVWGIETPSLAPGATLTLTLSSSSYFADYSNFAGTIAAGSTLYVQVDSAGLFDYGNVLELNEDNNIYGPMTTAVSSAPVVVGKTAVYPHH